MVGYYNPNIFILEGADNALNVFYRYGVNACKGFVEQDKLGIDSDCTGNFSTAAFTARKFDALAFADLLQSELFDKIFEPLFLFLF